MITVICTNKLNYNFKRLLKKTICRKGISNKKGMIIP